MPKPNLDKIIHSLSDTSGSFDDYTKRVKSIIDELENCKKLKRDLDALTETNKQLNDAKLRAEKQLKDCNDVRNKTDYVKMKQDFETAISNKETQILELTNANRKLKSDLNDATAKSVEMVHVTKKESSDNLIPADFKAKCKTPVGQREMTALADKYVKMSTKNKEVDEHYHKIGNLIKEKCFNTSTKPTIKLGGKSRKAAKSRKSRKTKRVYSLDPI